ncbi:MAG: hypothetical protein LUC85_08425 [Bacteroidales bacterium]|nr:hypothetical protein [Bacteroidales bacterium]MCD8394839.1 hypothetical protein [Bacteroidales bacterium]
MKIKFVKPLLLVAAVLGTLTSCNDDGYWKAYDPGRVTYTFMDSSQSISYKRNDTTQDPMLSIDIRRSEATEESTVKVDVSLSTTVKNVTIADMFNIDGLQSEMRDVYVTYYLYYDADGNETTTKTDNPVYIPLYNDEGQRLYYVVDGDEYVPDADGFASTTTTPNDYPAFEQAVDSSGNPLFNDDGTPTWQQATTQVIEQKEFYYTYITFPKDVYQIAYQFEWAYGFSKIVAEATITFKFTTEDELEGVDNVTAPGGYNSCAYTVKVAGGR